MPNELAIPSPDQAIAAAPGFTLSAVIGGADRKPSAGMTASSWRTTTCTARRCG